MPNHLSEQYSRQASSMDIGEGHILLNSPPLPDEEGWIHDNRTTKP
jgi:hypothetical protein